MAQILFGSRDWCRNNEGESGEGQGADRYVVHGWFKVIVLCTPPTPDMQCATRRARHNTVAQDTKRAGVIKVDTDSKLGLNHKRAPLVVSAWQW